jgi:hypothetical protein
LEANYYEVLENDLVVNFLEDLQEKLVVELSVLLVEELSDDLPEDMAENSFVVMAENLFVVMVEKYTDMAVNLLEDMAENSKENGAKINGREDMVEDLLDMENVSLKDMSEDLLKDGPEHDIDSEECTVTQEELTELTENIKPDVERDVNQEETDG